MNAKEYLSRYHNSITRIRQLDDTIRRLEAQIDSLSISYSGMPRNSDTSDKVGTLAVMLADTKQKREAERIDNAMLCVEIENLIYSVNNPVYRELLLCRYVKVMKWEEIAEHMSYELSHVSGRLHSNALEAVAKLIQ